MKRMNNNFRYMKLQGRDFRDLDLSDADFSYADLTDADFSYADLRGANFTRANLCAANFQSAKLGIPFVKQIVWLIAATAFWALSILLVASVGAMFGVALNHYLPDNSSSSIILLVIILIPLFITSHQRLEESAGGVELQAGLAIPISILLIVNRPIAIALALTTSLAICFFVSKEVVSSGHTAENTTILMGISFTALGIYIGWRSIQGLSRYSLVRQVAISLLARSGTTFYGANLTGANFSKSSLSGVDFRDANLASTCWFESKNIEYSCIENNYMSLQQIQKILVTKKAQSIDLSYLDLQAINLQGVNLTNTKLVGVDLGNANLREANLMAADLTDANLKGANLHGANLCGAKLVQAQLDQVNLTYAHLTGAYIENWGITAETKLDNVDCKYVFMRLPTQENPEPYRKPDNRQEEFQPGDFADFIRPIVDTLDLYHNGAVDPRAIAISFKQLAENNPDANPEIVAMERRGNNKLLIRAKTAEDANLSQLNAEYFSTYNYFIALPPQAQAQLFAEKDNRIQSLEAMVTTALQRPSFYTENNIHKVNTMHNNPGGISQSVSGGNNYGGLQASQGDDNQIAMKTSVASSSEEKQLTQSEVIQLLAQIEAMIHQAELPTDVKEESALYLGAAKKATEKEEPKKALAAENLKSMAETVQTASKTVESSKSLWENMKPLLIQLPAWLGVAQGFFGF